jgi:SH3 domain-containing YSC84-like protein 1
MLELPTPVSVRKMLFANIENAECEPLSDVCQGEGCPMAGNERRLSMIKINAFVLMVALLLAVAAANPRPAMADSTQDARQLVEKARMTFEGFSADKEMGASLRALVRKAKAVLIYPQVLRGAFILGASGGSGVLLARDPATGNWSGPAFYTIGEASFGLQAGGEASEVVLVALTERGVTALLSTSAKLGANASVAVGPVGMGAEAATANLSADLVSYTRNMGLYGGISVEGAVVATRDALNKVYYGRAVTPTDILVKHMVTNPQSTGLITAVAKVAGGAPAARGIIPGSDSVVMATYHIPPAVAVSMGSRSRGSASIRDRNA